MSRTVGRIVLDVLVTVVLTLAYLTAWRCMAGSAIGDAFAEAAQRLFLFMDVGLGVWLILILVAAIRRKPAGAGLTLVFGAVGAMTNLVVVILVGYVQQGGWAELFILFAVEAGTAFLVAAVVAVILVHRVFLKPPVEADSRP